MTQTPTPSSVCKVCGGTDKVFVTERMPPGSPIFQDWTYQTSCSCQPQQERREEVDFEQIAKNIDKILGDCVCSVEGCKNVVLSPSIASVCSEHSIKTSRECCEAARADERKKVIEEAINVLMADSGDGYPLDRTLDSIRRLSKNL